MQASKYIHVKAGAEEPVILASEISVLTIIKFDHHHIRSQSANQTIYTPKIMNIKLESKCLFGCVPNEGAVPDH